MSGHRKPTRWTVLRDRLRRLLDEMAGDTDSFADDVEWDKPVPVHTISQDGEPIWNGGQW